MANALANCFVGDLLWPIVVADRMEGDSIPSLEGGYFVRDLSTRFEDIVSVALERAL